MTSTAKESIPPPSSPKTVDPSLLDDHAHHPRASNLGKLRELQRSGASLHSPQKLTTSISTSLKSTSRVKGPKIIRGNMYQNQVENDPDFLLHQAPTSDGGLKPTTVYHNLSPAELYEKALANEPGTHIVSSGALATMSGAKTGRSPKDKRVVREPETEQDLWWGEGSPNYEIDEHTFLINRERAIDFLNIQDSVYVFDGFVNWDPENKMKIRVICTRAYHALFMYNMLIRPTPEELRNFNDPDFTIYNAGSFPANRFTHYMTSSSSVDINLTRREMVILGTQYAGEMKKGVFSVMHYLMPKRGLLSLHSGCNVGKDEDVTLFFGLSGTGKTTLSTDEHRPLIGDDEHCWGDNGVFNIEGGCYAKCIGLKKESEPEIYGAIRFGTVLENVVFGQENRDVDFEANFITENTRASYPIHFIDNVRIPCVGPHPKNIILLCCDAFGVLPPVSRLTTGQAMYHFISGYTAKVAGTEVGVTEPEATFSACFGGAFLMWHPMKYASMLAEKMEKHGATAWLVNTGWSGGKYGVGSRMKLKYTRAIINAIHSGELIKEEAVTTPVFNLEVPKKCSEVPSELLLPETQWKDKEDFKATLRKLGDMFIESFRKYEGGGGFVSKKIAGEILASGPTGNCVENGHA
ncbi:hypothetical protein BSKO_03786 [Bryopsis sp. KO-2023]|nr:hypothetical protein BSKO_03786 [Bryopsis sp. KO-2023]